MLCKPGRPVRRRAGLETWRIVKRVILKRQHFLSIYRTSHHGHHSSWPPHSELHLSLNAWNKTFNLNPGYQAPLVVRTILGQTQPGIFQFNYYYPLPLLYSSLAGSKNYWFHSPSAYFLWSANNFLLLWHVFSVIVFCIKLFTARRRATNFLLLLLLLYIVSYSLSALSSFAVALFYDFLCYICHNISTLPSGLLGNPDNASLPYSPEGLLYSPVPITALLYGRY